MKPQFFLCLSFCLCLLIGCGDGVKYCTVTGTITKDGNPVPGLEISFVPINPPKGHGVPGIGVTDEQGAYKMFYPAGRPKIPSGEYKVSVSVGEDGPPIEIPQKYKGILTTVNKSRTVFDIDLSAE